MISKTIGFRGTNLFSDTPIFGSWTHSVVDFGGHGAQGDLRRDRRRPSHGEGTAPCAPFNGASLEALQGDPEGDPAASDG